MKLINERSALFIDGAHLYGISRALSFEVDYRSLLELFNSQTNLIRASYYSTLPDGEDYSPLKPLTDWLAYNGFAVNARASQGVDGKRKVRGSMTVEIACDLIESAGWLQHAIVVSGDGDLRRAVEMVQRRGVRVTVISAMRGVTAMIDDSLRRQCDCFTDISDISSQFVRPIERKTAAGAGKLTLDP